MNNKTVELGDEVVDKISGFRGIVRSLAKCLTGCDRADVTPNRLDKEGKIVDGYWFDTHQLKIVKKQKVKPASVREPEQLSGRRLGGPPTKSTI